MNGGVLIFILAVMVVIMVHEAGHFLVAKLFGFKATKFFLGFGPTIWSFNRGETEYGIKAIPAGGFVKIVGMNPYEEIAPEDRDRAYPSKPRWQRALLLVAGSATHWVVAFVLLVGTVAFIGVRTDRPTNQIAAIEAIRTRDGTETTAAMRSALLPDDRIVGVDGRRTESWKVISDYIRAHAGEKVAFTVDRDGVEKTISVRLGQAIFDRAGNVVEYSAPGEPIRKPRPPEELVGFLGVQPARYYAKESLPGAVVTAGRLTGQFTAGAVVGIGKVFTQIFGGGLWRELTGEGARELNENSAFGIVGAVQLAGSSFATGQMFELMMLIVGFTIFVGLMNLLPLPPLDGGHLAVVVYEALTKRTVDVRKLIPVAAVVIAFFLILFVAVLYLDLARPIKTPF